MNIRGNYRIYIAITAIVLAVILIVWGLINVFDALPIPQLQENVILEDSGPRHPLSGEFLPEEAKLFPVAVMIDNAYDIRPQYGLENADIVYEALVEANITRLLAIFDSEMEVDKLGPVRSARNYFMDWAEEYGGVYMHVGGSPQALLAINSYDFINVDQIGAGEIYYWRGTKHSAPHNVLTSSANWLRAGELKEVDDINNDIAWNFVTCTSTEAVDFKIDYPGVYRVEWKFNDTLKTYQRWQGDDKFYYGTGEQATADNIIVQVVDSYLIDVERRGMDTKEGGKVVIFNSFGKQEGVWQYENNRTRFYNEDGEELKLVSGKTWVQVVADEELLIF